MQNNNYGLPENILIILEQQAKQTGKSLDKVVKEYKKNMEEGKRQAEKVMEILKGIAELSGQDIDEVIKEAFNRAGLKMPNYQYFEVQEDFKEIKKGDTVAFNMDYTELENSKKYLIKISTGTKSAYICGEYNRENDLFTYGNNPDDYINNDSDYITVLGQMVGIQKESL